MKDASAAFERFTEELQRNPSLPKAVAAIHPKPNHEALVNVAHTFGHTITVEEVAAYKRNADHVIKNSQYLGSLLG